MDIIEKGYGIFQGTQGQIVKVTFQPPVHGCLARVGERFFIEVDRNECLELQVVTALHELAHLGKEFDEKTGRLRRYDERPPIAGYIDDELPSEVRKDIDEAVIKFYDKNFKLVDVIRECLSTYDIW